ncbi:MAG: TRAP transporter substrate-binding protein [Peptococcaceae bacterium]|nr:TRAP transporter substrate-binding protein [Peptococcaceae bacterium]
MKKTPLKISIALLVIFLLTGCGERIEDLEQVAPGEKIVIKFSHVVAEDTPKGLAAKKFAELAAKRTGGRVEVQVFPNSTLYADGEEMNALRSGAVQIIAPSTSKLGDMFPRWQVFDMPYAFESVDEIHRAMNGSMGKTLYGDLEKGGIYPLAFWDNGFKQITNRVRPLVHPSDFRGLTFRIMINSRILEEQFRLLGAVPVQMRFNEVYDALSSRAVDGQENTVSNIVTQKFHEIQPYLTVSNHGFMGYVVMADQKFWLGLPPDIRAKLEEVMKEVTDWEREQAMIINERDMKVLQESGKVKIHLQTPEEKWEWKRALAGLEKKLEEILGAKMFSELNNNDKNVLSSQYLRSSPTTLPRIETSLVIMGSIDLFSGCSLTREFSL